MRSLRLMWWGTGVLSPLPPREGVRGRGLPDCARATVASTRESNRPLTLTLSRKGRGDRKGKPMLTQLIWKQWKEQGWRVMFATVVLCGFVAIGLRARVGRDSGIVILTAALGAFILPIFIAMGLLA